MNPRTEALKFRIWQYATPREWNVTIRELAEHLDVSWQTVRRILDVAGWMIRVRKTAPAQKDYWRNGAVDAGNFMAGKRIASDVVAGKIEAWEPI